jgi:(p)ppGpp synthase/HD superfamily hydrolase
MTTRELWCIEQHRKTNHMYDFYLPYEFHLRMVIRICEKFKHLLPNDLKEVCHIACWGHDLIEDTRTSFNDCVKVLGDKASEIIYAVTNEKGRNRAERANDKYYEGIRNTPGAVFVKLCDRIANVQYSKIVGSEVFKMYKKENENFIHKLGYNYQPEDPKYVTDVYHEMFQFLINLFL